MEILAEIIYFLCAVSSSLCVAVLFRAYKRRDARMIITRSFASAELLVGSFIRLGNKLLFWCSLCCLGFFLTNVLLVLNLVFLPDTDLSTIRHLVSLIGVTMLLYGLIADRDFINETETTKETGQ